MARLTLSKSSLSTQSRQLKTFERFLPSLDLKRRQLIAERAKAVQAIAETEETIERLRELLKTAIPMAANQEVSVDGLVTVASVQIDTINIMGVRLPQIGQIRLKRRSYSLLAKPAWVDSLAELLEKMLQMKLQIQVDQRRLVLLDEAVKTVTQRVNLFDKVLIPRTRENIRKIQIFLADAERAAVVRAKIAKGKRAREALAI
jgi:V/A-type H+/Na+-transporting ATPase subunit D